MKNEVTPSQKLVVLILLVLQNAAVTIMVRYSRGVLREKYMTSSVVLMTEICKFILSVIFISMKNGNSYLNQQQWHITKKIWYLIKNGGYSWLPSACYFIQNSLQYVALENLNSSVYAVLQQLKILSAAVFSVLILSKKLPLRQWRALILLVVGGILIEYHTFEMQQKGALSNVSDPLKGTIAILTIISLSGLAGVITELLLKNKPTDNDSEPVPQLSLWDRNVQLAFWSIIFCAIKIFIDRSYMIESGGFFGQWTLNTWIILSLWTMGGILVAITIKYTDVIIKGFASAMSMVIISLLGYTLLNDNLDLIFLVGVIVTVIATFNYND